MEADAEGESGQGQREQGEAREKDGIGDANDAGNFNGALTNADGASAEEVNPYADIMYLALTFDDGPHPVYTPLLLDGLRERV